LIEQRLKQMEVALVHQRYVHGRSPQRLRGEQASESAPENDDAVLRRAKRFYTTIRFGVGFQAFKSGVWIRHDRDSRLVRAIR
jgi:hypothetical protein